MAVNRSLEASDGIGAAPYRVIAFRPERNATLDTLRWAKKRYRIPVLIEVDVTTARDAIRERRRRTGDRASFTAWVVSCVACAAAEHPRVHALRRGKRKLVLFERVDVAVVVEREIGDGEGGERETLPMPVVIRHADGKSIGEIQAEILKARMTKVSAGGSAIERVAPAWLESLFFRLPRLLRDLVLWRPLLRSPSRAKRMMGTVVVTSVGMAAPGVLAWGIPLSLHPLAIGVGGIVERSTPTGTSEILALTVVFDHAVTDGAPVGRFIHSLHGLLSRADGLEEATAGGGDVPA